MRREAEAQTPEMERVGGGEKTPTRKKWEGESGRKTEGRRHQVRRNQGKTG